MTDFAAAVEVSMGRDGRLPAEEIVAAYLASGSGRILLLLDGVTPQQCDEILDPVVAKHRHNLLGVAYRVQPRAASMAAA